MAKRKPEDESVRNHTKITVKVNEVEKDTFDEVAQALRPEGWIGQWGTTTWLREMARKKAAALGYELPEPAPRGRPRKGD